MKKYNQLFFTEHSREKADIKNNTFWIYLSNLEKANPDKDYHFRSNV